MNIVFWLLVILAAIAFWFMAAFLFYPLGRFLYRLWKDATDELSKEEKEKENEQ